MALKVFYFLRSGDGWTAGRKRFLFFLLVSLLIHGGFFLYLSSGNKEEVLDCAPIEVKLVEKLNPSPLSDVFRFRGNIKAKTLKATETVKKTITKDTESIGQSSGETWERFQVAQLLEPKTFLEVSEDTLLTKDEEPAESSSPGSVSALSSERGAKGQELEETSPSVYEESQVSQRPYFKTLVKPKYPEVARRMGKEGLVVLRVLVDEKGKVKEVKILRSAGFGFDEEAEKAIRQSLFEPAKHKGKPVACYVKIPVRFVLEED